MRKVYFLFFKGILSFFRSLFIKAALLILVLFSFSIQESYAQPGTQWEFSRDITLSAATPMNDFQVKIELNGAALHAHMKADGSDLRFYVGATPISYWIEKWDPAGKSIIWVKVPSTGTGLLTMYYGNSAATTLSNGFTTFDFFDDFNAPTLDNDKWASDKISKGTSDVRISNNGFLSNKDPFLPINPDTSFYLEAKHTEDGYHRVRYYTTTQTGVVGNNSTNRRPTSDYGYFSSSNPSSTAALFWPGSGIDSEPKVHANTNYITQWKINDLGAYEWTTIDYDANAAVIDTKIATVGDKLRYITIAVTEGASTSTTVDWVRVRKWDGISADINTEVENENSNYPLPMISSVNKEKFCEGEIITIGGVGFNSKFLSLNGNVRIGGTSLINPVSNPAGTQITASIGSGTSGKLKIITVHGDFTTAADYYVYPKPVISVGPTMSDICQGETTPSLAGSVTGGATNGIWTVDVPGGVFNEGATNLNTTWTPLASFAGVAKFTLTSQLVEGSVCTISPVTKTIVVNPIPEGDLTWPELTACVGTRIEFTAPTGFETYTFQLNTNSWYTGTNNTEILPVNAKTGDTVTIIATTSTGCSRTFTSPALTMNAIPTGTLNLSESTGIVPNDRIICLGDEINFSFDPPPATVYDSYKYTLVENDSLLSDISYFSANGFIDGDQVKLQVENNGCIKVFLSKLITVKDLPTAILESDLTAVCSEQPVTFTGSGGVSYNFLINDEIQVGASNPFVTVSLLDNEEVKVIVTDANKCSSTSDAIPMTIHALPTQPVISPAGPLVFCVGTTPVTLTATAGASSYQWYRNGAAISGATDQTYTTANTETLGTGTYKVKVTNENNCVSEFSLGVDVLVNPSAVKPTISGTPLEVCVGGSIELSSSNASTYQWYFSSTSGGALSELTGQNSQTIILNDILETGYYAVEITNEKGCAGAAFSDRKNIKVNALPDLPKITISLGKDTLCAGETVTLSAPTSTYYKWFKDGDSIAATRTYKTVNTLDAAGTYTVMVGNAQKCWSAISEGMVVVVNPLPEPTIDNGNICIGTSGNEYNTEPEMNEYVWTATGGGTITGNGTSSIIVDWANSPGSKSLNVSYRDAITGCKSTSQATFINLPPIVPVITPSGPEDKQVCLGTTVTYSTQTGDGENDYDWTFTGGGTKVSGGLANDNFIEIIWEETGSQNVTVNYTKNHCNAPSPTILTITVNPLPVAEFTYSSTPYCTNGVNPLPTMATGAKKGIFTAFPAGLNINSSTGLVNVSASTPGTYTVTNTIAAAGGCGIVSETAQITVTQLPTAIISYSGFPFCTSDAALKYVSFSGMSGAYLNGVFSAPGDLIIDPVSGAINPSTSTPGSYIVSYTIPATDGCSAVVVKTASPIIITQLPVINLTYTKDSFCISDNTVESPNLTGIGAFTGGKYTVSPTTGLIINEITGRFTSSASTAPGTYTITYTTNSSAGCGPVSKDFVVTITPVPTAGISYSNSPFCKTATSVPASLIGTGAYTGGVYSSTTGLSINPSTGAINPSLSIAGDYTVTYTIPATGGCSSVPAITSVSITDAPTVNAGEDQETCADGLALEITTGSDTLNSNTILWTTSGDGTFSNASSLINNLYNPGENDKISGTVTLTLTATGNGHCGSVSDTKILTINALPDPVVIVPTNPEFCEGTIQPLTSVKSAVNTFVKPFNSGTINLSIPDNNFTGMKSKITVSGIPANAIITDLSVKFNITHPSGKELIGNLRSPQNKEVNLFYMVGSGSNFTNTLISSSSINPIQTFGIAPFTGTFSPQGTLGAMGAAFVTKFSQLYTTPASLNGDWYLKLSDMVLLAGNTGTLNDWNITISYSVPVEPVPVVWSPFTDLFTDVAAVIPYTGELLSTVYTKVSKSGTTTYTAMNQPNVSGCTNSSTVDLIVRESPLVEIATDYCSDPGRVILTAKATGGDPFTYKWNTGSSQVSVHIDEARDYYVSATNNAGCVGTAVMSIAKELVINGDFEQGYVGGSFNTDYSYVAPPGNQSSLVTEGRFAIDTNANNYHNNFFGKDHTTPEQKGNFMIANGYPGSSNKVIWEQTVAVEPDTRYYYSAWAMNLNSVSPYARLQFSVNGVQIGSIAELSIAPKPTKNSEVNVNNWVRFYYGLADGTDQSWYSGTATTATIRIVNLEPKANGNDFGLDDISFATLSPFIRGPLADGADQQLEVCSGTPIQPIVYQMGSGVDNPSITGLPDGWEPTFDGLNYTISGTPVNNTNAPIRYDYTLTIKGCNEVDQPKIMEGAFVVYPNSTLEMTSLPENQDQSLCINLPMNAITLNASGQLDDIVYTGLPAGTSLYHDKANGKVTISGAPTMPGEFNYEIKTQGGVCLQDTVKGVIKISPESVAGTVVSPTVCVGASGTVILDESSQIGKVLTWQVSNDGVTFTDILNSANASSQSFTNINQSAFYRVKVKNEFCPDTAISLPGKIKISNLWEGGTNTTWSTPPNWSAGTTPTLACTNTITIPQVPVNKHEPWINAATGNAQVTNLTILPGGHLTVDGGNLQIKGNIINNGILDAKKGGVEYNGTSAQSIASGIFLNNAIGDLKINNLNKGLALNTPVDIYRSITFGTGGQILNTNDQLTLKSTKEETASVGIMASNHKINGKVTVERYINTGTSATGGHRKSWQLLATPTVGQSIKDSWMEGATASNIPNGTSTESQRDPKPGYGTMITSAVPNAAHQPTPGFDVYTAPGPSMKSYDPETGNYDKGPASTADPIYNPKGYLVLVRGDRSVYTSNGAATPTTLRTKGTLITGTRPVMAFQANTWNSVGNPYASAIDLKKLTVDGGVKDIFAVWDPLSTGSYGLGAWTYLVKSDNDFTAVPSSSSYPGGVPIYIQSGQAFMVQTAPGQSGTVHFTENAKVSGSNLVMRGQKGDSRISQLRANLYGLDNTGLATISDGILLQFGEDLSNEIDGKDARKMSNTSENLSIRSNGKFLAIERRQPVKTSDTIFLNLSGVRVQNYRFEVVAKNMQMNGRQGFLEDIYLGTSTPLNLENSTIINFNIENKTGSYAADRFRIVFKSVQSPLPVTFLGIKAEQVKEDILVTWNVEKEINVSGYDVEKSTDGVSFIKIGHVGAENAKSYNWVDEQVQSGISYYRIKMIDKNSKTEVSSIVKVLIQRESSKITVYPNPITNGVVNVHLINQPSGKYKIRLLNPVGQVIINKIVTHGPGNSIHSIDWDYKLARGMYQIEVTRPDGSVNLIKIIY